MIPSGKRASEFKMKSCRPPTGTVTFTHPDWPFRTLQNGTSLCGPASSMGNPRREVPPPEKYNWLVGTKLPETVGRTRGECCWQYNGVHRLVIRILTKKLGEV